MKSTLFFFFWLAIFSFALITREVECQNLPKFQNGIDAVAGPKMLLIQQYLHVCYERFNKCSEMLNPVFCATSAGNLTFYIWARKMANGILQGYGMKCPPSLLKMYLTRQLQIANWGPKRVGTKLEPIIGSSLVLYHPLFILKRGRKNEYSLTFVTLIDLFWSLEPYGFQFGSDIYIFFSNKLLKLKICFIVFKRENFNQVWTDCDRIKSTNYFL